MTQVSVIKNLAEVRAMIKRHKLNDYIFSVIGLIALMVGLLTLLTLFVDLLYDGSSRFNMQFLSDYPSRRARTCRASFRMGRLYLGNDYNIFNCGSNWCCSRAIS
jgi:hypothetical protein